MAADGTIIDDENYRNIDDPPEVKNINLDYSWYISLVFRYFCYQIQNF